MRYRCGVDIAFLSVYPGERETIFPPLTYLTFIGEAVRQLPTGRNL
eukprot:COSAG02_NODE_52040_length_310_cov_0.971564_1_plen_45_part_01